MHKPTSVRAASVPPLPAPLGHRFVLTAAGERYLAGLHGQRDAASGRCARPAPWGAAAGCYFKAYLAAIR